MRRAVLVYCGLAYAITWIAVSPLVATALGLRNGALPDWLHVAGAAGPILAAFLSARFTEGADGVDDLRATLTRFHLPAGWWLVAVASPVLLLAIAVVTARIATGGWTDEGALAGVLSRPSWWIGVMAVSLAFGLGEEPGWRGFLLPRLMRRHSALVATLLTGAVWAAWHAPFFAYRYDFAGTATIVGFFTAMVAGAFWLTFLYLSTDGSVPATAAWHVVWNVVNLAAAEISGPVVALLNGAMIALGFGVLVSTSGRLQWRTATTPPPVQGNPDRPGGGLPLG